MIEVTTPPRSSRQVRTSLKERVLAVLRHEISTGVLGQGERLVENELTRRLNVSRTPLREALRQLESEGLVVVEPHKGARVSRKTRDELWEHYRIYAALQGLAAELAAPRLTQDDLDLLRDLQESLEGENGQGQAYADHNRAFHDLFVERAGADYLQEMLHRQALYLARFWPLGLHAPGVPEVSRHQHQRIIALCNPPQPEALRQTVEAHFLETGRLLLEHASTVYAI